MRTADFYSQEYYESTYDKSYAEKQQRWLNDYLAGKEGGFSQRIHFLFNYFQDLPAQGKLLDLGCGVGTFALVFAQRGLDTIGLDISEASIEAGRANAERLGLENCSFVQGSGADDHFDENYFDAIFAADIIEHLPQHILEKTLANCLTWLKPGGKLYIHTTPTKYYYFLTNKPAPLLAPALLMPPWFTKLYVKLLDRTLVQLLYKVRFGKSYDQIVANTGHCNPPHPMEFKQLLNKVGFKFLKYDLREHVLSNLSYDQPRYSFGKRLIKQNLILRPSILALVQKPNNTKLSEKVRKGKMGRCVE